MRGNLLLGDPEISEAGTVKRDFFSPLYGAGTIENINPQLGGTVASVEFHDRLDFAPQVVQDKPGSETATAAERTADLMDSNNAAKLTVAAINQAVKVRRTELGRELVEKAKFKDENLVKRLLFGADLREIKLAK